MLISDARKFPLEEARTSARRIWCGRCRPRMVRFRPRSTPLCAWRWWATGSYPRATALAPKHGRYGPRNQDRHHLANCSLVAVGPDVCPMVRRGVGCQALSATVCLGWGGDRPSGPTCGLGACTPALPSPLRCRGEMGSRKC